MQNYLINKNTVVLFSNKENTIVIEKHKDLLIHNNIKNIINDSCKYYCSSLKGRIDGSNYLLGTNYKSPIIISEAKNIIFFPTTSYRSQDCIWINYAQIDKYYAKGLNTIIEFRNKKKITIKFSNKVINNQILKSSRLESILKSKNQ